MTAAEYKALNAPKATGKATTPAGGRSAPQRQKLPQEQPPTLRPAYCVVPWPDSPAFRFVCHGISEAQVEMLRQACDAAGIPQQN